ncbi:MAG TPA: MBL fold metallo-hydrolase [Thermoanaerobaculia bacterium]|nr:MBL fold metallo-hydrolase [Thermoanaerobaculia bacterium]
MRAHALLLIVAAAVATGCSSVMPGAVTSDHKPFDYAHPPCAHSVGDAADKADIRYLGTGGVFLGWRGSAVLFGPFFTNPPLLANLIGNFRHDRARIAAHLRDLPLAGVRAIVTGHSHYDHFGDVPVVASEHATAAAIYTNTTGVAMLAPYPSLRERVHAVRVDEPFTIRDTSGTAVMRIRPVASDHAPQVCCSRRWPCNISSCQVREPWISGFESHALRDFCGGDTFAYVVDLLDARGAVAFRLYYNDSAPEAPLGVPAPDGMPYDVAILTIASYHHVHGYPEAVLRAIRPRHVLLTHYEDFFSKSEGRWHFVALLTEARAKRFVERMLQTGAIEGGLEPEQPVCGAAGIGWTMPVPGEQARFRAR